MPIEELTLPASVSILLMKTDPGERLPPRYPPKAHAAEGLAAVSSIRLFCGCVNLNSGLPIVIDGHDEDRLNHRPRIVLCNHNHAAVANRDELGMSNSHRPPVS